MLHSKNEKGDFSTISKNEIEIQCSGFFDFSPFSKNEKGDFSPFSKNEKGDFSPFSKVEKGEISPFSEKGEKSPFSKTKKGIRKRRNFPTFPTFPVFPFFDLAQNKFCQNFVELSGYSSRDAFKHE